MKRFLILAMIVGALFMLLWPRPAEDTHSTISANAPEPAPAASDHNNGGLESQARRGVEPAGARGQNAQLELSVRNFNETYNMPVAFYGVVVDQDTNALEDAIVDLEVLEQYYDNFPNVRETVTRLRRQTGADGRFEVLGITGHSVTVVGLVKDGYEPELRQPHYGIYGANSASFADPPTFKMWNTNIHERLIAGEKAFVVVPDGRHYAIDVFNGTIAEGEGGDLVAWIQRPETVRWGQRYDWACEVRVPGGGLLEDGGPAMCRAPHFGYTNAFTYREEAARNGWGGITGERRFYVHLRNGQYGRIIVNLHADYFGKKPAMIQLSYAFNPSGSTLLR